MSHTVSRLHRRRMGEILVSEGLISSDELDQALAQQRISGELLGAILVDMGLITESDITKTLSAQYQIPFLTLDSYEIEEKLVSKFPAALLHQRQILPFDEVGNTLLVLVGEIPPIEVLEEVGNIANMNVALYVGYPSEVAGTLAKLAPLPETESTKKRRVKKGSFRKVGPQIEIVTASDDEDDDVAGLTAAAGKDDPSLFGGDSTNLMEQLDSTWNSIFQEVDSGDDDDDDDD